MIRNLWEKTSFCWITSLIISCTIPDISYILILLLSNIDTTASLIVWYILSLSIQVTAIILGCRAFIISQKSGQFVISILCTIFANIVFLVLLFFTTAIATFDIRL